MDQLTDLHVFSIGNNNLSQIDNVSVYFWNGLPVAIGTRALTLNESTLFSSPN